MANFPLTHVFGVTRSEYYKLTGITPEELIRFYEAEIVAMSTQLNRLRRYIRKRPFASSEGRYLVSVYLRVTLKIDKNRRKIQQIKSEDL